MNQFVVDFGDETAEEGDEVVLFGPGDAGEPTVQEWADTLGTISYEIVTRFGGRTSRSYFGVAYEAEPVHAGAGTEVPGRIPASPA
jgi:alanine racemase